MQVQNVTPDIATALGMPDAIGAMVATVAPGGPAAKAHLQPGDVILGFDGRMVPDMKAFRRMWRIAASAIRPRSIIAWRPPGQRDPDDRRRAGLPCGSARAEACATTRAARPGLPSRPRPDPVRTERRDCRASSTCRPTPRAS